MVFPDFHSMAIFFSRPVWSDRKEDLPLWSPTTYKAGTTRGFKNVSEVTCLVYDVDDGPPFTVWAKFAEAGLAVIAHTSFSFAPELHKFRIILPLSRSIPAEDWKQAYRAGLTLWDKVVGRGQPDRACSDASRIYYVFGRPKLSMTGEMTPKWHVNLMHEIRHHEGKYLNLKYQKEPPKKKFVPKKMHQDKAAKWIMDNDPAIRREAASLLNAQIVERSNGSVATRIDCPNCQRKSVYFFLNGVSNRWASCNHQNSCGWYGTLNHLINPGAQKTDIPF